MEKLRERIIEVAGNMTEYINGKPSGKKVMGELIPLSYKLLIDKIKDIKSNVPKSDASKLFDKDIPIITSSEYINIIRSIKSSRDVFEDEDLDVATRFLHNIGKKCKHNGFLILDLPRRNDFPINPT